MFWRKPQGSDPALRLRDSKGVSPFSLLTCPSLDKTLRFSNWKNLVVFVLGLPLPSVGSGCVRARRSARPFAKFASLILLGLALRATLFHPSAEALAGSQRLLGPKRSFLHLAAKLVVFGSFTTYIFVKNGENGLAIGPDYCTLRLEKAV